MYKDNLTDAPRKRFDTLKKIWENKNIIIVEGSQTRLGVGNDLFANTKVSEEFWHRRRVHLIDMMRY